MVTILAAFLLRACKWRQGLQGFHRGRIAPLTCARTFCVNSVALQSDNGRGLEVVGIGKSFERRVALRDVSLHVRPGEIVGLFGRDGAGKTVCMEAIMGLASVDAGRILLDGRDITALTVDRRGPLGLSYLAQDTSIFRGMTTQGNIAAVLEETEPDPDRRVERLEQLLAEFNIAYIRDTPAPRLSGGERRRCEIARAMASSPSIMLLDEPFAGIDPMSVVSISGAVRRLRDLGVGILITDQNVQAMIELIDRAYVLHMGRIVFDGEPWSMMADDEVHRVYLGPKKAEAQAARRT